MLASIIQKVTLCPRVIRGTRAVPKREDRHGQIWATNTWGLRLRLVLSGRFVRIDPRPMERGREMILEALLSRRKSHLLTSGRY